MELGPLVLYQDEVGHVVGPKVECTTFATRQDDIDVVPRDKMATRDNNGVRTGLLTVPLGVADVGREGILHVNHKRKVESYL